MFYGSKDHYLLLTTRLANEGGRFGRVGDDCDLDFGVQN
jgi:hypothetical protein